MVRAQPWLNSSISHSAKKLVYHGNLTQKGEKTPMPTLPLSPALCLHMWSLGGHFFLPWEEDQWILLYFNYLACVYPKVEIALLSWQMSSSIWLIPRHKYYNLGGTSEAALNLASYLINHRPPVKSGANHSPAPQDQGAGLP